MNGSHFPIHVLRLLFLTALLFLPALVLAQSGGGYDLTWNTIDGGGYTWSEVCNHTFNKGFHRLYHCMDRLSACLAGSRIQ